MDRLSVSSLLEVSPSGVECTTWIISLLIGLVTFYVVKLWMRIKELPPGPIPIPGLGNLLEFRSQKTIGEIMKDMKRRYGPIYTIWLVNYPVVVIADWALAKEATVGTRKNDFNSRIRFRSINHLKEHCAGIVTEGVGRAMEVKRKIGYGAVRKFADDEKLAILVKTLADETVDQMLKIGAPFDPTEYLQDLISILISETAFGSGNLSKDELALIRNVLATFQELGGNTPGDLSPFLLLFFYQRDLRMKKMAISLRQFLQQKFHQSQSTYQPGEIRSFSDAIIKAKLEAEQEGDANVNYLDDDSMIKIIGVLFIGGTETTATTLRWILLHLANRPDIQQTIFKEIERHIGNRIPLQEDRRQCPYTWAVISEVLRFRTTLPIGVARETNVDTELNGYKIRKGTTVVFDAGTIHEDPNLWEEPDSFKPERFLKEDGTHVDRIEGFLAFGAGKRMCIGEKMARNDLFLLLVNILQKVELSLEITAGNADLEPSNNVIISLPKKYNIVVTRR